MAKDMFSGMDETSLSHLSSQLRSLGFIHRPLDLPALFAATQKPSSRSAKPEEILAYQKRLQQETRAREQVIRLLWSLLGARDEASERLEEVKTREQVLCYEMERSQAMVTREKRRADRMQEEREAEAAKAKAATAALAKEQDRHRHANEELTKAKSALQLVRTQAAHDQKRREAELTSTMARLQKLTSDPAQSKFVVLNTGALPAPTSHASLAASARPAARNGSSSTRTPTPTSSAPSAALESELAFVQDALDTCDKERIRLEQENGELREVLSDVDDWSAGVKDALREVDVEEEEGEAADDRSDADESALIPRPHLTLPPSELSMPLHTRLYRIRVRVSALLTSTAAKIEEARHELVEDLQRERDDRRMWETKAAEANVELENARALLASSEQLVQDFANQRLAGGQASASGHEDASDDDVDHKVVEQAEKPRKQPAASRAKETDAIENFEAQRSMSVAAFLDDLGIDSPAPPLKTLSASTSQPKSQVPTASSSTATTEVKAQSQIRKSKSSRPASKAKSVALPPLAEESPRRSSSSRARSQKPTVAIYDDAGPPSPFLTKPSPPRNASTNTSSRTALAGLLAANDSPNRDTLSTSQAPAFSAPQTATSVVAAAKARAREAAAARSLAASQSITNTKTTLSVSTTTSRAKSDENVAPRSKDRRQERPTVF